MFADDKPGVLRYSTIMRRCREQGLTEASAELERVYKQLDTCPTHGFMPDPIVGHVGDQIAICCPYCSGNTVREAWEAEGKQALA